MAGMVRLVARAYSSSRADWDPLNRAWKDAEGAIQHLAYEGDILLGQPAASALEVVFAWRPQLRDELVLAVAQTDQRIGRDALLQQFAASAQCDDKQPSTSRTKS